MSTIALNNLWEYILGLSLSQEDKQWLIEKLNNDTAKHTPMPCCFTDEEWKQEVRQSELEGEASEQEVKEFFQSWKHVG